VTAEPPVAEPPVAEAPAGEPPAGPPDEPTGVRAMPMILRMERAAPPTRTDLLEAAATAVVAVVHDPRSAPGGEWHDEVRVWSDARIRKLARRARGAHWLAVQELAGVTVAVGTAEVRALVPSLVADPPREVARLQITGSDLPVDEPGPPPAGMPVLWINPAVEMTVGKAAAQVGHASMLLAQTLDAATLAEWAVTGFRCAVRTPSARRWADVVAAEGAVPVRDAGLTEVAPGTVTVIGRYPH